MAREILKPDLMYYQKTGLIPCYWCMVLILFTILLFINRAAFSQRQHTSCTIYGVVKDAHSGETLPYAHIIDMNSGNTTISNEYGFYSIRVPSGKRQLKCLYVGYKDLLDTLQIFNDTLLNIKLLQSVQVLDEVLVSSDHVTNFKRQKQISTQAIPINKAVKLPSLLGETDLLKVAQLLPGIQSGHEGSSEIFVRGGGGDQNLYIIDGIPIYNITHLMGFISIINEDAVSSMKIIKGGFPAQYHGRLSSVIDLQTKEGNLYKYEGGVSIGLLSAKFNVNGPVKKGKGSFFISGRRSYIDWLARPFIKSMADGSVVKLYFYDLNGKANYMLSKKSRIYFTSYFGNDIYKKTSSQPTNSEGLKWGNFVTSFRWNYLWNTKMFSNLSVSYTKYTYLNEKLQNDQTDNISKSYFYQFSNGIKDLSTSFTMDYFPDNRHKFKGGVVVTAHTFTPGITTEYYLKNSNLSYQSDTTFGYSNIYATEVSAFAEDTWNIKNKFTINYGISTTLFKTEHKTWTSFEPRFSINYSASPLLIVKMGYARMTQFMHLLRFSSINLPTDFWVPAIKQLPPETSDQYTAGVFYTLNAALELSAEVYYKQMNHLTEYKEGASFFTGDEDWESKIETGKGWAYGIELMINKRVGKFNGWINYTWSKSERKFANINYGRPFPFRFDRRNDLKLTGMYKISKTVDCGLTWVYGTGYPVTMVSEKYASYFFSVFNGNAISNGNFSSISNFPFRNNYRMPAYHHLDVNFNFHHKTKFGERIFSAGVYNVYNRLNAFYLEEQNGKLYKIGFFPVMPFVRLMFKFY